MRQRIDPDPARRARDLRNNPTPTELAAWHRIIRLSEVLAHPDGAVMHILAEAAECLGGTHPQPLPCREEEQGCCTIADRQLIPTNFSRSAGA